MAYRPVDLAEQAEQDLLKHRSTRERVDVEWHGAGQVREQKNNVVDEHVNGGQQLRTVRTDEVRIQPLNGLREGERGEHDDLHEDHAEQMPVGSFRCSMRLDRAHGRHGNGRNDLMVGLPDVRDRHQAEHEHEEKWTDRGEQGEGHIGAQLTRR